MDNLVELNRILQVKDITTVFQPIICLKDSSIIGYEALSRGPEGSALHFPDKLFQAAKEHNLTWELDHLCRIKALEKANSLRKDKYLFINVDPKIINDKKFSEGFTKEFLSEQNLSPENIIFEITEKTAIEDYNSFKKILSHYINQGYKIAIDDTGAGYSGLKTLCETRPHFIKIDMDLVQNINNDTFKQAILKTFVSLSEITGMKLIAEGIETEEELITLINIGVYAGQGYFIQRPSSTFLSVTEKIKNLIYYQNKHLNDKLIFSQNHIGEIAKCDTSTNYSSLCNEIKHYFDNNQNNVTGICVVKNNVPIGLIMKHYLNSMLATQYGLAIFSKRQVSLVMDNSPLVVDYFTPVSSVSKSAMSRPMEKLYDYIIVTKNSEYYGIVTVQRLLEHTTMLERNYARELNPLTGLPGNAIIEKTLKDLILYTNVFCILYFDLDNFKVYNDSYGFENGDKIIHFTGDLIQSIVKKSFPFNSFVGHIGGDDFISVFECPLENCNELCEILIREFDKGILDFFNEKDIENGYIDAVDRRGNPDRFNLTSISIAGIYGNFGHFANVEVIGQYVASIKKEVKKIKGSSYSIKILPPIY